ncbi:microsomal triacylglycerol transfer protein isoform X2 [Lycorma delicatula]|uniref:microsomal triacylglycerol transfer protein isoform X2 n=1 Tax=Lycorma delicatula TaxID=130591 RepID=UPI003F515890
MEGHRICSVICFLTVFAAAGAGTTRLFQNGVGFLYDYQTTTLLNEAPGPNIGSDVGFQISAELAVSVVWQNTNNADQKLFKFEMIKPSLHIKSRKAPSPEGFVEHTSQLDNVKNGPFLIVWENGRVQYIYIDSEEDTSISNLKKGVASLFQFQISDQEIQESDASGKCKTLYKTVDDKTVLKVKSKCSFESPSSTIIHPDKVWETDVKSERKSLIEFSPDLTKIQSIASDESHEMRIAIRKEAGGSVTSRQHVTLTEKRVKTIEESGESVEDVVKKLEKKLGIQFLKQTLTLKKEDLQCQDCPSFYKAVKENREFLESDYLGTVKSAAAFVRLLTIAREAKKEEIHKVLKSSKNKHILPQLCDLIASTQTLNAHKVAMKFLHFDAENDLDINERYLWALSFGSHPVKDVLTDINNLLSKQLPPKLLETVVLTLAAVTNKYRKLPSSKDDQIIETIQSKLIQNLSDCYETDDECKVLYLRALQNLQLKETVPILVSHALNGSKKVSVRAMKTLKSLPSSAWNDDVLKAAEDIYFQIGRKFDSSARTLALDILLERNPSNDKLKILISSLPGNDSAYEVKQYLMQRINQIAYRNKEFEETVKSIIGSLKLNNYNILALKGLSTAFTRSFMNNPSVNGSLSTVQEISSGIVKQGNVDILLEQHGSEKSIFTLGLFAGGLSSFMSSDEEIPPEDADEVATAGMELNVLGVQIRPFVFFSGQGELMSHVWSGTGSERTPAFQALSPLQDHQQYIPLESGFIADLTLLGGVSFDLSGQIQLSLWNRNAQSLVEKNAGISVRGTLNVDTMFVRSQVEFNLATEVKLNLISNIDFYNIIALCLQLRQPDSVLRHNIFKIERIPGSKHRLRKSKYKVLSVPGKTYALNQKNNEMCNIIFKEG